jgi:serine/threonine-protein kinase
MAMVYLGLLEGDHGFKRSVAVKRMHAQYARDPDFREMFLDEARLVAQIRHPNVVPTLDIVSSDNVLLIVMEFVEGECVSELLATTQAAVPPRIAAAIVHDVLCGLHAAHELADDGGRPLGVIHRDVSPANVIVGKDGLTRILDFGVAKTNGRSTTHDGAVKGKVPYMPPEQLWGSELDRTVDIYAASVVFWEMLTGRRLFEGEVDVEIMKHIVDDEVAPPSTIVGDAAPLDELIMRGLSRDPSKRWLSAIEMAHAIETALTPAPRLAVADWVKRAAGESIARRSDLVRAISRGQIPPIPRESAEVATLLTDSSSGTAIAQSLSRPPTAAPPPRRERSLAAFGGALAVLGAILALRSAPSHKLPSHAATAPPEAPTPAALDPATPSSSPSPARSVLPAPRPLPPASAASGGAAASSLPPESGPSNVERP